MEGRGAFLRVGALILGGIALLIGLVIFLAGNPFRQGEPFETYFRESVQGLDVGAPVKYLGVTLGRVTEIGLAAAEYGKGETGNVLQASYRQVYVRFVIDRAKVRRLPSTETAIKTGLRAKLASQGLTGLSYIEIAFVSPTEYPPQVVPWQPKYEYIPSMPSTLSQVQEAGEQFLAKLNRLDIDHFAANVDDLLTELRANLKNGDIHQVLARLDATLADIQAQVKQADLPGVAADLRTTLQAARETLGGRETRDLIANADSAAEKISAAAGKLNVLIQSLQPVAQRATDLLTSLTPIVRDFQAVASNLRDTTAELRRYPAGLLLGGPPPREAPAR